jgi:hypothetical protein
VVTTSEIQAYLEVQFGIKETLERIKEASDIVDEVRLENEEESEEWPHGNSAWASYRVAARPEEYAK